LPALIALIQVSATANPAAAWRYFTVYLIDGMLYALFACSIFFPFSAVIVYSFAPFDLHPWRIGGSVLVMVSVPGLCTVAPCSPGWNIVV
jgi:hypothetical protein